jgi:hypothetical protein
VNQEIVAWTLADNPEVVHERLIGLPILERQLKAGILGHASCLILITGSFTRARDTLRLEMTYPADIITVDRKMDHGVQPAAQIDQFSGPTVRTWDENG